MHEMSIALEVCRIAEDQVGLAALGRVREIGVVVGVQSGVEPDSLLFCLEALLASEPFRDARPSLEMSAGDDLRVSYLDVDDEPDVDDEAGWTSPGVDEARGVTPSRPSAGGER